MFLEMLAVHALDPLEDTARVSDRDPTGRKTGPGHIYGSCPEVQLTGHLQRKSINGKRITLHHVGRNGKPHYIGLPAVLRK